MSTITDSELADELHKATQLMKMFGYDFTGQEDSSKEALTAYLQGYSLCLAGSVGTGKTYFFETLQHTHLFPFRIVIYSLKANDGKYTREIQEDLNRLNDAEVVIDDLGAESDWGGKRPEIVSTILAIRQASPRRTFFTTNLTRQQLQARYDDRIVSRLKSYKFIPMIGEDKRKPTANWEATKFLRDIHDPNNWTLCKERCNAFVDGKCTKAIRISPQLRGTTPESMCDAAGDNPFAPTGTAQAAYADAWP